MSVTVMLELRFKPESVAEAREVFVRELAKTRGFKGANVIDVLVDEDDEAHWIIYEVWETVADDEAYRAFRAGDGKIDRPSAAAGRSRRSRPRYIYHRRVTRRAELGGLSLQTHLGHFCHAHSACARKPRKMQRPSPEAGHEVDCRPRQRRGRPRPPGIVQAGGRRPAWRVAALASQDCSRSTSHGVTRSSPRASPATGCTSSSPAR